MRLNGVRSLDIYCNNQDCLHRATMNVDAYPGHLLVKSFEGKLVCSRCGGKDVEARPNWSEAPQFRKAKN